MYSFENLALFSFPLENNFAPNKIKNDGNFLGGKNKYSYLCHRLR